MQNNLDLLLSAGIIDEILGRLKSGKEADVFRVRYRGEVVAAKVYKDRHQRSFKNNAAYKEGRKVRNSRTQRAMDKGSRFGRDEAEDAWKSAEASALQVLHTHGVRVPIPVMFYEGVLLMQLVVGADGDAAPRLIDAPLLPEQAGDLYRDLRRQIIAMLCCDLIHGDLSPYNVLLGAAGPTIIDFPQTISAAHNTQSETFFRRDLDNILSFLASLDRRLFAHRGDAGAIWRAYTRRDLTPDFVPAPVREERVFTPPPQGQPQGQAWSRGGPPPSPDRGPRPPQGRPGPRPPPPQHKQAPRGPVVVYVGRGGSRELSPRNPAPPPAPPPQVQARMHAPVTRGPQPGRFTPEAGAGKPAPQEQAPRAQAPQPEGGGGPRRRRRRR